jgi:hypothetical protein
MLQSTSKEFRTFFLLKFTEQLIKHSSSEIYELEDVLKEESKEKEEIQEHPLTSHEFKKAFTKKIDSFNKIVLPETRPKFRPLPVLRIPEPKIPERFRYLQPIPTRSQIDLGKLNPLINDPRVEMIESAGTNQRVIVTGRMGRKATEITLDYNEIRQIFEAFSKAAKIPLYQGVFKIVVGRLILSAINSELVNPKFIIRKMAPPLEMPRRF